MNEDSAETSQIGMNFAAPKVVVTDRSGQGMRALGAAKLGQRFVATGTRTLRLA